MPRCRRWQQQTSRLRCCSSTTLASDFLARAHELHPRAKRVLLVDRDYSSTSPAVQAMALGRADYHIVRPWADDEMMYGAMSEYLSSWTREQEPNFELFRIVAEEGDSRVLQLRDVMTRFSMPFGFYAVESEAGRRLLDEAGLDATRLPVVIRYDGQVIVDPSLPDLARADRRQRQERRRHVRGRHRRRGTGGPDGRRLRRVRGARDGAARTGALGRAGRHEPADQELSRVSPRHQRRRCSWSGPASRRG